MRQLRHIILLLLFSLLSNLLMAQSVSRRIFDSKTNMPVAYANVGVIGRSIGTLTNEKGEFSIKLSSVSDNDIFRISSIGYKAYQISVAEIKSELKLEIFLEPDVYFLKEVEIKPHKWKYKKLGNTSTIGSVKASFPTNGGTEIGIPINIKHNPTILENFSFYLMDTEHDTLYFRFNVYNIKNEVPADNILSQNIYFSVTQKNGWVTIDLKSYNIIVSEDIFISLEFVKGYKEYSYFSAVFIGSNGWTRYISQDDWEKIELSIGISMYVSVRY